MYKNKYLKYKSKYLEMKNLIGGKPLPQQEVHKFRFNAILRNILSTINNFSSNDQQLIQSLYNFYQNYQNNNHVSFSSRRLIYDILTRYYERHPQNDQQGLTEPEQNQNGQPPSGPGNDPRYNQSNTNDDDDLDDQFINNNIDNPIVSQLINQLNIIINKDNTVSNNNNAFINPNIDKNNQRKNN